MNNKEVYVVSRLWYDFEDDDCNSHQIDYLCNSFYTAKKKVLSLIIDELESDMEFDEQFGEINFTLENILERLDKFNFINLKQKYGNGKTQICIDKRKVEND